MLDMSDLNNLKTDKMSVDVKLAEEYFKQHQNTFSSLPKLSKDKPNQCEDNSITSDGYNNIMICNIPYIPPVVCTWEPNIRQTRLKTLADEIEKNQELFSQIEFLIRKKPVDEVKKYDIKLLSQNLKYLYHSTTVVTQVNRRITDTLVMGADAPLAFLGYLAQMYLICNSCTIVARPETAAVAYLFTELCYLSGMNEISLRLTEVAEQSLCGDNNIMDMRGSCLGVVTGQADVDSSVDAFLNTTTKYPWKLSRILVQESVYETFKNALKWKTRANSDVTSSAARCSAFYIHRDKHFFIDYAGEDTSEGIAVEAYRTTKELLSLLTREVRYMSLWTNDISEANELVHHESSPDVIWVNDYGVFQGPPISSQAVYKLSNVSVDIPAELKEKQALWLKKSFEDRYHAIYYTIFNYITANKLPKDNVLWEVLRGLQGWNGPNVVSVNKDTLCTCYIQADPTAVLACSTEDVNLLFSAFGRKLTIGCLLCIRNRCDTFTELLQSLVDIGAPIELVSRVYRTEPFSSLKIKAIWSNYGTIFAN